MASGAEPEETSIDGVITACQCTGLMRQIHRKAEAERTFLVGVGEVIRVASKKGKEINQRLIACDLICKFVAAFFQAFLIAWLVGVPTQS
jgi:hypothetical protein